jgi:hypothetical protein
VFSHVEVGRIDGAGVEGTIDATLRRSNMGCSAMVGGPGRFAPNRASGLSTSFPLLVTTDCPSSPHQG